MWKCNDQTISIGKDENDIARIFKDDVLNDFSQLY